MNPPDDFDESAVPPVVRRRRSNGPTSQQGVEPTRQRPPTSTTERTRTSGAPAGSSRSTGPERSKEQRPQQRPAQQPSDQQGPDARRPKRQPSDQQRRQTEQERRPRRPNGHDQTRSEADRGGARTATEAARRQRTSPEEEYVVLPSPTNAGRRLLTVFGVVVLIFGLLIGGVLIWASRQVDPAGDPGERVAEVVIPTGSSTDSIAALLADEGVVTNARLFRYYVSWQGAGPWNAGEYVDFREGSSFDEAIEVLDAGPVPASASAVRVTEGTRLSDALVQISEQLPHLSVEQLQQALDSGAVTSAYKPPEVTSWEGLLFPDSYQFEDDATPEFVLQTMATKMDSVLDSLGYERAEALQGRTAYDLIVIASLIERETGAPEEERGMISRVIVNRLDDGETLGIDATVLYGLDRTSGELTQSDLDVDTPYNTRLNAGLPPTPISLSGEASLAAAISPAEGTWRYYVLTSNDPPSHFFTDSYRDFLDARDDARDRGVF